jgi:hypothetical protein
MVERRLRRIPIPKGRWWQRWLLPFAPWVLLAVDFAVFPVLILTTNPAEDVTGNSLIKLPYHVQYLGHYKTHRIYVSLDDIDDEDYLSFLGKGPPPGQEDREGIRDGSGRQDAALAVVLRPQNGGWGSENFTRILHKLESASLDDDRDGVIGKLKNTPESESVVWYDFKLKGIDGNSARASGLPLDHLIMLRVESPPKSVYFDQVRQMLETARKKHVSTLVVEGPSLLGNPCSLSCGDTYDGFFQALEPGSPSKIFLSLEKNGATAAIQGWVESIKQTWKSAIKRESKAAGAMPTLYQSDLRLLLLFLCPCLFVCSFRVEFTPRNLTIICIAFVASGLEVQDRLAPLLSELAESVPAWVIKCGLLAILSGGFMFFAGLDIEGLLKGKHDNPH